MKKIYNIFAAVAMASFFAASCATEELPVLNEGKVPMTITACDGSAAPETSTVLYLDKETQEARVCFTSEDKLYVYGQKEDDIKGTQFKAATKGRLQEYTFSTANWPEGYTPIYAVATTSTDAVKQSCTADGKITMLVDNSVQKYKWSGSYAVNTTGHVGTVEDGVTKLKNVCGLIGFRVSNPDITKIVVKGNGDETLGGWVKVDYAKLISGDADFYTTVDNDVKFVELTVNDYLDNDREKLTNGCFPNDTSFFISLLPGAYTSGLSFTLFNSKGESAVRNIPAALPIGRSQIREFESPLDQDLEFKIPEVEMPETLTFSLLKGKWPFEEKCLAADAQKDGGDEYTYPYVSADGYNGKFKFVIEDAGGAYTTSSNEIINTASAKAYIKFPAIEGRVLQSITICTRNAGGKTYCISSTPTGKELGEGTVVEEDIKTTWYSDGLTKTLPNTSYYLCMTQSGSKYTKIEAVYVKELSPTPIVVPEEFTAVIDFSEAWPFENKITAKASQAEASETCDGEVYDFKYSETATLKFGICKGKVNEYTHSETEKESGINCLNFPRIGTSPDYADNEGFFKIAAIPGRYLKEVKVTTAVNGHTIYICKSNKKETSGDGCLKSFSTTKNEESSSGELASTEENTAYYLFRSKETAQKYVRIELVYGTKK